MVIRSPTRRAAIVGTGGQCRVVLSILYELAVYKSIMIYDVETPRYQEVILGASVTGHVDELLNNIKSLEPDIYIAIGNNERREKYYHMINSRGGSMPNLISKSSSVNKSAILGAANVVCPNAYIGPEVTIGDNNLINTAAILEHEVTIGNHCHFAPGAIIAGRSKVGDYCMIGVRSSLVNNISVASHTTIGAGATVVGNIDEINGTYIGTPAKRKIS